MCDEMKIIFKLGNDEVTSCTLTPEITKKVLNGEGISIRASGFDPKIPGFPQLIVQTIAPTFHPAHEYSNDL